MEPQYCKSLEKRSERQRKRGLPGFRVSCEYYERCTPDADVYTWWQDSVHLGDEMILGHLRQQQRLGRIRASARAFVLFDQRWRNDVPSWRRLRKLATWTQCAARAARISFDAHSGSRLPRAAQANSLQRAVPVQARAQAQSGHVRRPRQGPLHPREDPNRKVSEDSAGSMGCAAAQGQRHGAAPQSHERRADVPTSGEGWIADVARGGVCFGGSEVGIHQAVFIPHVRR
eukprot:2191845-Prymnesium_polylepis.1